MSMKKISAFILAGIMALSMCACGDEKDSSSPAASGESSQQESAAESSIADESSEETTEAAEESLPGFDLTQSAEFYSANNITVKAEPIYEENDEWIMDITVENNNPFRIGLVFTDIVFNGYTFADKVLFSPIDANATKTKDQHLIVRKKIEKPSYASMGIVIENYDEREQIDDLGEVVFRFADYGYEEPDLSKDLPLYESDKIDVYVQPEFKISDEFGTFSIDIFAVNKSDVLFTLYMTNPVLNGNPYDKEGVNYINYAVAGMRTVFNPFLNTNSPKHYGIESAGDVTSVEFDYELIMNGSEKTSFDKFHAVLKVDGGKISVESVEKITD